MVSEFRRYAGPPAEAACSCCHAGLSGFVGAVLPASHHSEGREQVDRDVSGL